MPSDSPNAAIPPATDAPPSRPALPGAVATTLRPWHRPTLTQVPLQVTALEASGMIDFAWGGGET
jgi:hypothetical protein